jgi:hypothetical protein
VLRNIRLLHRYLGLFFSPAILVFAFSGAIQTFNLHQANTRTGYLPPTWVVEMAQIHKKQTMSLPKEKTKPASPELDTRDAVAPKKASASASAKSSWLFKCFVLVMSVGLMVTTLLGIYMAFRYGGSPLLVWGMLTAGTLLPAALLFL